MKAFVGVTALLATLVIAATGAPQLAQAEAPKAPEDYGCSKKVDCGPGQYCIIQRNYDYNYGTCQDIPKKCGDYGDCACLLHELDCPPGDIFCWQANDKHNTVVSCQDI